MSRPIALTPTRRTPSIDQARALHRQGRLVEAERVYSAILADDPTHFDALHLLGVLRHQQGREVEALRLLAAALDVDSRSSDALSNFGLVFATLKQHQHALEIFDKALDLKSNHVNALNNRGLTLDALGRTTEALDSWSRALAIDPCHPGARYGRGNALFRLKRFAEALVDYDHYLALTPGNPDVLNNRGIALTELGRHEQAIASYDRALALDPDLPEVLINKGHAFADRHQFDASLTSYADAARFEAKRAEAAFCASLVRLRLGDFARGWREYEWRWKQASWGERARDFAAPLWLGREPLAGKTILLHAEQGFGDTLQFVRYAPLAARCGATVLLEVQAPLRALLSKVPDVARTFTRGEPLPGFDLHCPLMSLPLAFDTAPHSIPAAVPYIDVPPERLAKWRVRLGEPRRLRVGFAWAGSPVHERDRSRSMQLEHFSSLLSTPGIEFVCIQKDLSVGDTERLRGYDNVISLAGDLEDFADTAAVVSLLDLVVSVDTSVVHVAGAIGKPVWVLLSFLTDFRWLLERDDSPWYPSARLFRQPSYGDWDSVLDRVGNELRRVVSSGSVGSA